MVYHIYNKSIADFVIFNNHDEFSRMIMAIRYYQDLTLKASLSSFLKSQQSMQRESKNLLQIICYCLMPTHLHLMVKEKTDGDISKFSADILNSYTRYFNLHHKRKGPLWEGRSKQVLIKSDEQLLHTTRYIHLNPVTAHLVNKPEDWPYSSYNEYMQNVKNGEKICSYSDLLKIDPASYRRFVEEQIPYQRKLARIKSNQF